MWRRMRPTRAGATEMQRLDGMEIEKESRAEDPSLAFPTNKPSVRYLALPAAARAPPLHLLSPH